MPPVHSCRTTRFAELGKRAGVGAAEDSNVDHITGYENDTTGDVRTSKRCWNLFLTRLTSGDAWWTGHLAFKGCAPLAAIILASLLLPTPAQAARVALPDETLRLCLEKRNNDFETMIRACTEVILSDQASLPDLVAAFISRGEAWVVAEDPVKAIHDYDQAIGLDPVNFLAHRDRARAWSILSHPERALADYDELVRLDPANPDSFGTRGDFLEDEGDLDHALADYGQWISLAPNDAEAYIARARVFERQGQLLRAIADLDQAISRSGDSSRPMARRGAAFLMLGKLDQALADLDRSLRIWSSNAKALADRCIVRWRLGRREAAFTDCAAAQRLLADYGFANVWPWTAEAGLQLLAKDLKAAETALAEALRRNPHDRASLALRAVLRQRQGDPAMPNTDPDPAQAKVHNLRAWLTMYFGPELLAPGVGDESRQTQ